MKRWIYETDEYKKDKSIEKINKLKRQKYCKDENMKKMNIIERRK